MAFFEKVIPLNLQLFAEGGGAGGDGGTGGDGASGVTAGASLPATKGGKNPLANVQYGKQDGDSQVADVRQASDPGDVAKPTREQEFEKLIKGDYKDLYDARVSNIVQQRLKASKEAVDKYNALSPTLDMLARKYGISDPTDIEALNKAIEEDDSYYEEEALEKGVTVEQLKSIKKMERENAELKKQMEEQNFREQAERDVATWMEQAKEASKSFPNLDLGEELRNPQFISLLKSGIDVGTAYFAIHHETLIPKAMEYTAKSVEQKVVNKIASQGARPLENGVSNSTGVQVKSDVSQLSKKDRQEIARRVALGEKIRF